MGEIEILSRPRTVSMADDWYQFATENHFWMRWRHHEILKSLKSINVPLKRALEIGCGAAVARSMLERDLAIPVDGCDLNQAALEKAKPGIGRLLLYDIFDREASMVGRYDAIFLLDVLEHIRDHVAFLLAAVHHLRAGGIVVVNVPAGTKLTSQYDTAAGHLRRYRPGTLLQLFKDAKLEPKTLRYWGGLLVPVLLARKAQLTIMKPERIIRAGFFPPNRFARLVLDGLMKLETGLAFPTPLGSSLIAVSQRPPDWNG